MRVNNRLKDKQNKGFSVLTVIISVAFVGILAMLVLYMALSNLNMKVAERKGDDSFYTAERALEEIRTGLQEDIGDSMSRAYIKVLEDYNKDSDTSEGALDELRQAAFEKEFLQDMKDRLEVAGDSWDEVLNQGKYDLDHVRNYVDLKNSSDFDEEKESLVVTNPAGTNPVMRIEDSGILIKNLKVIYVDPRGLASIIETDIRLTVPKIQFPTPSTLPDLMNMIVVADSGIICKGEPGTKNTITGSIYAGLLKGTDQPSGTDSTGILIETNGTLDITAGDKVVSEGEVYAQNNSSFISEAGVNLWAQGVRLSSADVELEGTTYLSDDLTVEKGSGSKVSIGGEYYGYGSPDSARSDKCWNYTQGIYKDRADSALSSAIVINGKNTTMDLSDVRKLMVAGKNYISGTGVTGIGSAKNESDIMTGESLTVKGTQLAYLLPAELLNIQNASVTAANPMTYTDYLNSGLADDSSMVQMDTPVELWGGNSLSQIGVDQSKPVQKVFYNDNSATGAGGGYVYFYLNFTDDSKAADFMNHYYFSNDTVRSNMNKYLSFYFGPDTGITVNDRENYLRYVTKGNILTYDGNEKNGTLENATDTADSEKLLQEQTNYQNSWYALNRKMITSVDLLKTDVKDEDGQSHNETDASRSVFDNLVNEKGMIEYLRQNASSDLMYQFTSSDEDGGLTAIMYHNGASSTYTDSTGREVTVKGRNTKLVIDQSMADKLRLVICTGDVEIEKNVQFKGIIMAKGTITLMPGAQLESSPLDAAKVFQSAVGNGQEISPKQFFWEGDKYVLGNSTSKEEDKDTGLISDSYKLSDYVSYENWRKE